MVACDDRTPHPVEHLVQGCGGRLLHSPDLVLAHRPGGVDDDDLRGIPRLRLPRGAGARAADGDDGMDVRPPVGQELVLVDVS